MQGCDSKWDFTPASKIKAEVFKHKITKNRTFQVSALEQRTSLSNNVIAPRKKNKSLYVVCQELELCLVIKHRDLQDFNQFSWEITEHY